MKTCPKCKEKRKNKYFNPSRTEDVPDWCMYCVFNFIFWVRYKENQEREKKKRKFKPNN